MTYEQWLKSKGMSTATSPVAPYASKRRKYEDFAPVSTPVTLTKDEWLQSGALGDGVTKENVSKAILGSGTDIGGDLIASVLSAGETTLDAIAGIAGNVGKFFGADEFAAKTEAFIEKQLYDPDELSKTILSGLNGYGFASSSNMGLPVSFSAKDNEWRTKGQEAAKNYVFNTAEADSVLGTKADALVRSIGQQLLSRTLGTAGVPWQLTTALTTFGAEMDNALNNGATMGEAGASASVSAAGEVLSEMLFGGGIIGAKGFFGNNAKEAASALGKGIAVNLWNTAKGYATDIGEEALEEVFSEAVSRLGTAIYKADSPEALGKLMLDKDAWQDYLDAAIGGAVMGGLASGKKAVTSATTGRNYETGLTQNEQKVFKAEYNNRLAEAKKKGDVSKEAKQEIYDNVLRDIQKGRIHTDTIEKVLGGKDYTAYQDSVKNEEALQKKLKTAQKEYDDLMHSDITEEVKLAKEQEIADLEAQLESKAAETAKNTLSDNVFKMVAKDTNLRESYYERGRRSQKFEADVSKYKDGSKEIVQKAIDSGILNNTRATHDLVDFVAKAAPKVGTTFNWTDNAKLKEAGYALEGKVVNGFVNKDGITLNVDSNKALNTVVGHEIAHVLEGTELYDKLSEAVVKYAQTKGDYDTRLKEITALYNGVENSDVNRELVADLVGDYLFTDSKFLDQLAQNQSLFQKIWSEVKYLYNIANAGSREAKELLEVKRAFERAWNGEKAQKNTTDDGGVRYQLKNVNGKQIVWVEKSALTNKQLSDHSAIADYIESHIGDMYTIIESGQSVYIGDDLPGEFTHSKYTDHLKNRDRKTLKVKNKTVSEFGTLIETATNRRWEKTNHPEAKDAKYGMYRYDSSIAFLTGDAKKPSVRSYDVELIIRNASDGKKYLYDIVNIKENTTDALELQQREIRKGSYAAAAQGSASKATVPQPVPPVKGDYSLSASDGKPLTAEQQAYFKDSKVRDLDGNLKVMYQGGNGDFTVFDRKKSKPSNLYGRGFYFTDSESHAKQYGNARAFYLHIKNPVSTTERTITKEQMRNFLEAVAENDEDYSFENYGYGATVDGVLDSLYSGKSDFAMLYDVSQTAIGDMVEAVELFNEINGTDFDGLILDTETVTFRSNQAKNTDNKKPTSDPDVRFAISADTDIAPIGNYNVYGKDVKLASEDIAPVATAEDIAPVNNIETPDKIVTAQDRAKAQLASAYTEMSSLGNLREASIQDFNDEIAELESEYAAKKNKNTKVANDILRRIERTKSMRDSVDADYAKRISDVEAKIAKLSNATYSTAMQRKAKQEEYRNFIETLVGDTSTWVDKKLGIQYQTNTFKRNLRDVVRNADGSRNIEKADAIYNELQGKYNQHEAQLNRRANEIKKRFADLNLTNAEDVYVQMLGELRHNPETTLSKEVVDDYYEQHKDKIDTEKVDKAIDMARELYDGLFAEMNAVLREQGMKEVPYRKGYFPHFTEEKQGLIAKLFNWKTQNNRIPTDIAGLTEEFKPNRTWQSFNKQRTSDVTDYNFTKGLDGYVRGSLDWIYHIEDIQKRRAFENYIRYTHSDAGVKERINAIRDNDEYDANEMQDQIDLVYAEAKNPLNNFVTDLRTGTNTLAGKKSSMDRGMEAATNRQFYSTMSNISNRVSANMVGGSVSSALTNFIPITQSWGEVSPVFSLKAMGDTLRSMYKDDGVIDKSDFLTNRLNANENLYKTAWDKISDKVGFLMSAVDNFTSQTVWRSKYMENISKGMSESEAIRNADEYAAGLMADRSRGNMPTIFDSKNPLTKTLTAFQLEVANQYAYMFKDMPQNMKDEATSKLVKGYVSMFMGAYAYNALYSALVGRDAAFDPISILEDLLKDINDEEEEPIGVVTNLVENVLEEVPFVGGLLGGGRVPIQSALPYNGSLMDMLEGAGKLAEGDLSDLTSEWLKPVYYGVLPMGGGQIKKTMQGLAMFDDDLPIAGSYTNSGNLRFTVEDTVPNRLQAALFGQYASKNARQYFDENRTPLGEKQIRELVDVGMPIADYWEYRDGLKKQEKLEDKFDYIAGLDLPVAKKNILINNVVDRKTPVDLTGYDRFSGYEEFDFYSKNTEKYNFLKENGVSYQRYMADEVDKKNFDNDYAWYKNNPDKVAVAKLLTGNVLDYRDLVDDLSDLPAKEQKVQYINDLDMDYNKKIILYRTLYSSEKDKQAYNKQILNYLFGQNLPSDQLNSILKTLGFVVKDGYVSW